MSISNFCDCYAVICSNNNLYKNDLHCYTGGNSILKWKYDLNLLETIDDKIIIKKTNEFHNDCLIILFLLIGVRSEIDEKLMYVESLRRKFRKAISNNWLENWFLLTKGVICKFFVKNKFRYILL